MRDALLDDPGDITPGQVAGEGSHPRWSCMSEVSPTCEGLRLADNARLLLNTQPPPYSARSFIFRLGLGCHHQTGLGSVKSQPGCPYDLLH